LFCAFCIKKDKTQYYAPSAPACFVRDRTDTKKITSCNKLQRPSDIIASNGLQNKQGGQALERYFHKTRVRPSGQTKGVELAWLTAVAAPGLPPGVRPVFYST
jgi:hypothetical protein